MKSNMLLGLAVLGLSTLPVAAYAVDSSISYDESMKCSSLYSYLSDESDDDDAIDRYIGLSNSWFDAAIARDGTEDGSRAQNEFDTAVETFFAAVDAMKNKKEVKSFLASEQQICTGKQAQIADEFEDAG